MFASIPPCFLSQSCDSVLQVDVLEHVDTVVAAFAPTAYAEDVDIEVGYCVFCLCYMISAYLQFCILNG